MDKLSYALGIGIGTQLSGMGANKLNIDDFAQAIKDVIAGNELKVSQQEAQTLVNNFFAEQQAKQEAAAAEAGKVAKAVGEGNGKKPSAKSQVKCHYEGTLIDGTKFDSSYDRGEPATFGLNQVIPGWTEGVQLMGEGAKYRFFIPYNLGYGERGAGASIPPYAALIFVVELIEVL